MATLYSDQYGQVSGEVVTAGVVASNTSYIYKGPSATTKGQPVVVNATYNLANGTLNGTNTQLVICKLPEGGKGLRISISSGDDDVDSGNSFTFNLGTTTNATAFASADTGLQAGGEVFYTIEATEEVTIAAGDELIFSRQANALNSSGTLYFVVEMIP